MNLFLDNGGISWLGLLAAAVGAVVGAYFVFRADRRVEERRRSAAVAAAELDRAGFSHVATMFRCYSVGDYHGAFEAMHAIQHDLERREHESVITLPPTPARTRRLVCNLPSDNAHD